MNEMTLEYPESWLAAMGLKEADFVEETRMAAAMKLFERGRFPAGRPRSSREFPGSNSCSIAAGGGSTR